MSDLLPERGPDTTLSAMADTDVVNAREAAACIGVNERTIRRAIARGDLRAVKRGGTFQITVGNLRGFHHHGEAGTDNSRVTTRNPNVVLFPGGNASVYHRLPRARTSFIGRESEIAMLVDSLGRPDVSLVTLIGPGGVGKTRLALAVADVATFPSGACFVDLATVQSASLVQGVIARALGASANPTRPLVERLAPVLNGRKLLLVLDNFEHLLPAASDVASLLDAFPELVILITSRSPLRVSGEQIHVVAPLDMTVLSTALETENAWPTAVRLFVERAQSLHGSFKPSPRELQDIAALCQRLDGLPLAIELAAAQVRFLPPRELLARTTKRLPLLVLGARDLPARQQTMRDTIAWSYNLLDPGQQTVLRWVSVFVGGISLAALIHLVQQVAPAVDPLSTVASLVDSSLLDPMPVGSGDPRFSMLETIREFGQDMLDHHAETRDAHDAHARFFLGLGSWLDPNTLDDGERFDDRLPQIEAELPNVLAALSYLDREGDTQAVLALAGRSAVIWHHRGYLVEGRRWLEHAIGNAPSSRSASLSRALAGLSLIQWTQGAFPEARRQAHLALAIAVDRGDVELEALARHMIALAVIGEGEDRAGRRYMLEALALWQRLRLRSNEGMALMVMSSIEYALGYGEAARRFAMESIELFRLLGHASGCAFGTARLAWFAAVDGDVAQAQAFYLDALRDWASIGERWAINAALLGLADIAIQHQQPEPAAILLGAVDVRVESGELVRIVGHHHLYTNVAERVRLALQAERFETLRRQGRDLDLADLIDLATGIAPSATVDPGAGEDAAGPAFTLTPREHQVLLHMVEGMANRQIAATLFVSERTVEHHVQHILGKLGVTSRTAAVSRAIWSGVVGRESPTT